MPADQTHAATGPGVVRAALRLLGALDDLVLGRDVRGLRDVRGSCCAGAAVRCI